MNRFFLAAGFFLLFLQGRLAPAQGGQKKYGGKTLEEYCQILLGKKDLTGTDLKRCESYYESQLKEMEELDTVLLPEGKKGKEKPSAGAISGTEEEEELEEFEEKRMGFPSSKPSGEARGEEELPDIDEIRGIPPRKEVPAPAQPRLPQPAVLPAMEAPSPLSVMAKAQEIQIASRDSYAVTIELPISVESAGLIRKEYWLGTEVFVNNMKSGESYQIVTPMGLSEKGTNLVHFKFRLPIQGGRENTIEVRVYALNALTGTQKLFLFSRSKVIPKK